MLGQAVVFTRGVNLAKTQLRYHLGITTFALVLGQQFLLCRFKKQRVFNFILLQ